MMSWPLFPVHARLSDGTWIGLRPIRPNDAPGLQRLVHELSPDSRYQRFFAALRELSPEMLRYLTEVDGKDHVATAAVLKEAEGERIIGVARFVRQPDRPRTAEAAITIVDDMQHKGLGKKLLGHMVEAARHDRIDTLVFFVKRSNVGMRGLMRSAGAVAKLERDAEMTFELPIPPPSPWLLPLRAVTHQMKVWGDLVARL